MKNVILSALAGAFVLMSCAGAKTAQSQRAEFLEMKGDWQITSINYDQNYKIKPFDQGADANCFVGSQWHLVPNNNTGSYTVNGSNECPSFTQPISFQVQNGTTFLFKQVPQDVKRKQVTQGYELTLVGQTENSFSLEQNIPFDGENVRVVYNFQRVGN